MLVIVGQVQDAGCQPAGGATIHVWHTDAAGQYGPGHGTEDLRCCYYEGTARADGGGRFLLETIRPGRYDQEIAPPAHIHIEISHSTGRLMTEILFAGDPDLPATAGRNGTVVVALTQEGGGEFWYGVVTLVLEGN